MAFSGFFLAFVNFSYSCWNSDLSLIVCDPSSAAAAAFSSSISRSTSLVFSSLACLISRPSFLTYSAWEAETFSVIDVSAPFDSSTWTASGLVCSFAACSSALVSCWSSGASCYYYVADSFSSCFGAAADSSLISVLPSACSVWVASLSSASSASLARDFIWANRCTWDFILAWSLTCTVCALEGDGSSPLAKKRSMLTMFFKKPHSAWFCSSRAFYSNINWSNFCCSLNASTGWLP